MAHKLQSSKLQTRASRLKLPVAWKPVFLKIAPGLALGYRRNKTSGSWVVRVADGGGRNWTKAIGTADDYEEGSETLDFWQAQDRARIVARGGQPGSATVATALDRYSDDLKTRSGDTSNAARVRIHLDDKLAGKIVALLTAKDLRKWRDTLAKSLAPSSVNRTANALRAALNLAADHDERIVSRRPWEIGLATIPDAEQSRNVILPETRVRAIIAAAYEGSQQFGLLVETAAVTGARVSQLARLEVRDLQADRNDPRLMMPSSRKGHGKKIVRRPVPIPTALAMRLRLASIDKAANAPLLVKPSGEPWRKSDHSRLFTRAAKSAGADPSEVTIYALRHSSIVRQLLAGVPTRVVAVNHDTSVVMIERTYSRHIADHSDTLARNALLDTSTEMPTADVVPLRR